MLKTNVIHCGECAEIMQQHIPDASIDLTVTSPPYDNLRTYNGYTFDFEAIAQQLWRVTKPGGVVVWIVADATVNGSETGTSFRQALGFMGLGFNLHDTMIYEVAGTGAKGSNKAYWQAFEFMFVFSKGDIKTVNRIKDKVNISAGSVKVLSKKTDQLNSRKERGKREAEKVGIRTNIWRYHAGKTKGFNQREFDTVLEKTHDAPFPEALARDHIISWSNPGDIVLDPFCGSGTTLKMSVEQGRQYIGIDISPEYVELSTKRVAGARIPLPGLVAQPNKAIAAELLQPELLK